MNNTKIAPKRTVDNDDYVFALLLLLLVVVILGVLPYMAAHPPTRLPGIF